jgi:Tfp pilus assembly protein PilN
MDMTRIDRLVSGLTHTAARRDTMRSLGVSGLALLATLGLAHGSARGANNGDTRQAQPEASRKKHRKKKHGHTPPAPRAGHEGRDLSG